MIHFVGHSCGFNISCGFKVLFIELAYGWGCWYHYVVLRNRYVSYGLGNNTHMIFIAPCTWEVGGGVTRGDDQAPLVRGLGAGSLDQFFLHVPLMV
jgi:hypothetical protein